MVWKGAIEKNGERVIINALIKKMAEELAEFLLKKGIKANYMHSETKTLERIEIISEKRAIDTVERRRKIQMYYNKKHKIAPKGIKKEIKKF